MFVVKELVDSDLVYYLRYAKMIRCTRAIENWWQTDFNASGHDK